MRPAAAATACPAAARRSVRAARLPERSLRTSQLACLPQISTNRLNYGEVYRQACRRRLRVDCFLNQL